MYSFEDRRFGGNVIKLLTFIKHQDTEDLDFNNKIRGHNLKVNKSRFNWQERKQYVYNSDGKNGRQL